MLLLPFANLFQNKLFQKIFRPENYQSVKQLWSRSGPPFCQAWSWSTLFAKVPAIARQWISSCRSTQLFAWYLLSATFFIVFSKSTFSLKSFKITRSWCQTQQLWFRSGLIWMQIVYKGCQQMTLAGKEVKQGLTFCYNYFFSLSNKRGNKLQTQIS